MYPIYGLGELPNGFARLGALHGGVFMLKNRVKKIHYDSQGVAVAVETDNGMLTLADNGKIIGDPSYFMDTVGSDHAKVKKRAAWRAGCAFWTTPCPTRATKTA